MQRLPDEVILKGILHPDPCVRDHALGYFADSPRSARAAMEAAVQAIERWGWKEAFQIPHVMVNLTQTEATLDRLVEELAKAARQSDPDLPRLPEDLSRMIAAADAGLLLKCRARILDLEELDTSARQRIIDRIDLLDRDGETSWAELERFCEEGRGRPRLDDVDIDHAYHLVEAIARDGDAFGDRVLEILAEDVTDYEDNPMVWMEGLAARLAGEMRLEGAVPHLVDKLFGDDDWTHDQSYEALMRIGTDAVVEEIHELYPGSEDSFRMDAAGILEHIHSDASLEASLAIFGTEGDPEQAIRLGHAILAQHAPATFESMREFILETQEDPELNDLRDHLVAVATLAGRTFPELEEWRGLAHRDRERRSRIFREILDATIEDGEEEEEEDFDAILRRFRGLSLPDVDLPPVVPVRAARKVGRNEPCPCGSGKKHKKCCLGKEEVTPPARGGPSRAHALDEKLAVKLLEYGQRRFGEDWDAPDRYGADASIPEEEIPFFVAWSVYHCEVGGRTVAESFAEKQATALPPEERSWLDAQRAAWISVWEVTEVRPDAGLALKDLLTGASRRVQEVQATRMLREGHVILGRVADWEGQSVLAGVHHRPLSPLGGREVVRAVQQDLESPPGRVPPDRLRSEGTTMVLIEVWRDVVDAEDHRPPPLLQNMDGDVLLMVTDHYDITPGSAEEVVHALASLEGATDPDPEEGATRVSLLRDGDTSRGEPENVVIGTVEVTGEALRIEANSVTRADALRQRVEEACAGRITHLRREQADMHVLMDRMKGTPAPPSPDIPPEVAAGFIKDYKTRHYEAWLDMAIPALGGATPRQAARDPGLRNDLVALVREMEHHEARLPPEKRFDFGKLRRQLGV